MNSGRKKIEIDVDIKTDKILYFLETWISKHYMFIPEFHKRLFLWNYHGKKLGNTIFFVFYKMFNYKHSH